MFFEIEKKDANTDARLGKITTRHGEFATPAFLPWGGKDTLKAAHAPELRFWGAPAVLVDAFVLSDRPGESAIAGAGGVHNLLGWKGPIFADSGRFADKKAKEVKFFESGIFFQPASGRVMQIYTPEQSLQTQSILGADIALLQSCPSRLFREKSGLRQSVELTVLWAERGRRQLEKNRRSLPNFSLKIYATVQGGASLELRLQCATELNKTEFDGFAIADLFGGTGDKKALKFLKPIFAALDQAKPRHVYEAGEPEIIARAVAAGADSFDSTQPIEMSAKGRLFIFDKTGGFELLDINKKKYRNDPQPPDNTCNCYVCLHSSKGELYRQFLQNDPLAMRMALMHNFRFYFNLMEKIRRSIKYESFSEFLKTFKKRKNS